MLALKKPMLTNKDCCSVMSFGRDTWCAWEERWIAYIVFLTVKLIAIGWGVKYIIKSVLATFKKTHSNCSDCLYRACWQQPRDRSHGQGRGRAQTAWIPQGWPAAPREHGLAPRGEGWEPPPAPPEGRSSWSGSRGGRRQGGLRGAGCTQCVRQEHFPPRSFWQLPVNVSFLLFWEEVIKPGTINWGLSAAGQAGVGAGEE